MSHKLIKVEKIENKEKLRIIMLKVKEEELYNYKILALRSKKRLNEYIISTLNEKLNNL